MNKIALTGRLAADPQFKYFDSGTALCNFAIAVDGGREGETYFFDCEAWKVTAESLQNARKGNEVSILGQLKPKPSLENCNELREGRLMGRLKFTEERQDYLIDAIKKHGDYRKACQLVGISVSTLRHHYYRNLFFRMKCDLDGISFGNSLFEDLKPKAKPPQKPTRQEVLDRYRRKS